MAGSSPAMTVRARHESLSLSFGIITRSAMATLRREGRAREGAGVRRREMGIDPTINEESRGETPGYLRDFNHVSNWARSTLPFGLPQPVH